MSALRATLFMERVPPFGREKRDPVPWFHTMSGAVAISTV
jgi:hypothetical protein